MITHTIPVHTLPGVSSSEALMLDRLFELEARQAQQPLEFVEKLRLRGAIGWLHDNADGNRKPQPETEQLSYEVTARFMRSL